MCGIAGILRFDGALADRDTLRRMTAVLRHRGPDGEGVHISGSAGLGHRRLAIIDLSPEGAQPMTNEDETIWLTYNGEIYNHLEIRHELLGKGHRFRSQTDTEVVIHAYEEWGTKSLDRFAGMFAFGLWDAKKKLFWLVRDRLGIKPLFYAADSRRMLFASEIKGILASGTHDREIDFAALHHFLSLNYTPAPFTLFRSIRQLLPGHYLICTADGRIEDQEYWDIPREKQRGVQDKDLIVRFEELMAKTVGEHLMSDVPFGAFLSGGLDSSGIVHWMSRTMSEPVKTFSVGFKEETYNELPFARETAQSCGTEHHEQFITADLASTVRALVWHAEEPTADSSMLPMYFLAKSAAGNVKMVLTGDGADEILAGYETYQAHYAARMYRTLPVWLRRNVVSPAVFALPAVDSKASFESRAKRFVAAAGRDSDEAHGMWRIIFDEEAKRELYSSHLGSRAETIDTMELYRDMFRKAGSRSALDRMLYVDTRFYLPNDMLVKVDRMCMAHSIEARVPYLDHRVVEFAFSLPDQLKLRSLATKKYILKSALHERLPKKIVGRKKQGFNIPHAKWFKGELRDFVSDHLSSQRVKTIGWFDTNRVERLLDDHFQGRREHSHEIWGLLVLSIWYETHMSASKVID
jgi:asparagine synthase (glutamine-hydrolysing)